MASCSLWKTFTNLWKTCGFRVEKRQKTCGNSVDFVGKSEVNDKNCKKSKSHDLSAFHRSHYGQLTQKRRECQANAPLPPRLCGVILAAIALTASGES